MQNLFRAVCLIATMLIGDVSPGLAQELAIDFNRDVRPILVGRCTSCHGGVKEAGGVSFVNGAAADPVDGWLVDVDAPDDSVLIERVTSEDEDMQMPPPGHPGGRLSDSEIQTLRRWIAAGAIWQRHWSLRPIDDRPPPTVASDDSYGPIDTLINDHRSAAGLSAAEPASPTEWLRRVSFDLTGLPPTIDQIDEFECQLTGAGPGGESEVYARQIDRLLADPAFGGRWASVWLDLARYADSSGYEKDGGRDIWPYRDWVVNSFNADMPYDDFTVLQLAGDLLPADDLQRLGGPGQTLATAFHRNTMTNTEGGTDDEEYRIAAVIDRVATTWSVWQGTTMGCVQCHAHPYDAFDHEDFYRSLAIFNNTADADLPEDFPTVNVPVADDPVDRATAIGLQRRIDDLQRRRNSLAAEVAAAADWSTVAPRRIASTDGHYKIQNGDRPQIVLTGGPTPPGTTISCDIHPVAGPARVPTITSLRIDVHPASSNPADWPEQGSTVTHVTAEIRGLDHNAARTIREVKFTEVVADALTDHQPPSMALVNNPHGVGGYPKLHGPRWAVFVPAEPIELQRSETLRIDLKCSGSVSGGLPTPLRRFELSMTDDPALINLFASGEMKQIDTELAATQKSLPAKKSKSVAVPVMAERDAASVRPTRMFIRGNWLDRGDVVSPGLPGVFAAADNSVTDRLDLARWLVSDDNPLAARVWANRIWATLFGTGLVETQEDFGAAGLPPVNARLLDHLAVRLRRDHRWHLKSMLRELVLSAAYRQTAAVDPSVVAADPANRLVARGPRKRLTAEMVRDASLSAAGLLTRTIGGPPVMPPQPEGVWRTVYSGQTWDDATGPDRYRRGLYTYIRRTSPYPSFMSFDAPSREVCTPRRVATNTPLQALVTLNDPVYHEAAVALAGRFDGDINQQIVMMFRAVTGQRPEPEIVKALLELYEVLATSATPEVDVLTTIASVILNTDEALTQ